MSKSVALCCCAGLIGCAVDSREALLRESFVPVAPVSRVMAAPQIEHRRLANSGLMCDLSTGARMSQACAVWNVKTNVCTIMTEPNAPDEVLGHEVRHCFEGHFH
ncbi:hypothetical protein [Limnohabitans planktonicus]|uniref:hypothetical protein n=1 Tax=Limnohabitans planktonicus TaxID=540060 RepID=UPI001057B7E0|nr:hypothetical protein [Limnohabitans planktonicus]